MQYFLKPIEFEDDEAGVDMNLDITFRIGTVGSDSATINFSMMGTLAPRAVDSACIEAGGTCTRLERIRPMFVERHDDEIHSRMTSTLGQQQLFASMRNAAWTLRVWSGDRRFDFVVSNYGRKAIASTYLGVIEPSEPIQKSP